MQKWNCSRCGNVMMAEISSCDKCGTQKVDDFSVEKVEPSRVTEVLDSSEFTRRKRKQHVENVEYIDEQINECAIEYKEDDLSESEEIKDIFEETSFEENTEATMFLASQKANDSQNTTEPTSPTVFIPTDSEIRDAFGERSSVTDETFVQEVVSSDHGTPYPTKGSLPDIGGNALSTTRSQHDGPSRFQRSDVIGGVFGRCRVIEKISEGAMGRVYKAYHQTLDKPVVLKELPPSLAASQELRERFIREAKACAKIHHQNVVQVLDAGYENGIYFYIMEYIDGANLEEMLKSKKKISFHKICSVIRDAAKGLQVAHRQGVVHRDIKASNIMVTRHGEVKVADFGLAYDLSNSKISVAGQIMGTPQYMSPEQWDGANNVDARSDLYSLGVTFYYALAERLPFDSGSTVTLFKQHVSEKPPLLRSLNPSVPKALAKIVSKLMEKDREKRYHDAEELVIDLEEYMSQKSDASHTFKYISVLVTFIVLACGAYVVHQMGILNPKEVKIAKNITPKNNEMPTVEKTSKNTALKDPKTKEDSALKDPKIKEDTSVQNEIKKDILAENNNLPKELEEIQKNVEDKKTSVSQNASNSNDAKNQELKIDTSKKKVEEKETKNSLSSKKEVTKNKSEKTIKTPIKKIEKIVLPKIRVITSKKIYNSFPIVIKGQLKGKISKYTRVILLLQKGYGKKYKRVNVRLKKNRFILPIKRLQTGKYRIIPQVFDKRNNKKRTGKIHSFTVDTMPPKITLHSPQKNQIFYEERSGVNVNIQFSISDFSSLKHTYLMHKDQKIPLDGKKSYNLQLYYGKQNCYLVAQDKAGNTQKLPLTWALVPRNMVRIPGGSVNIQGKQTNYNTFYIDKYEVTNAAYSKYLDLSNAEPPIRWKKQNSESWKNKPVVFVNYEEAKKYSSFLQKRLPTEVEWIVAALYDSSRLRKYPWGDSSDVSWPNKVAPVGSWAKDRSNFGVYDLASSVSEWVQGNNKALRKGGSFILKPKNLRRLLWEQVHFEEPKSSRKNWLGFRCAFSE